MPVRLPPAASSIHRNAYPRAKKYLRERRNDIADDHNRYEKSGLLDSWPCDDSLVQQVCVYPSSSAVPLKFDAAGLCSGCRVHEQKKKIDWDKRIKLLLDDIEPYRKSSGYECVIGVSGGKDSYYQTHFVKETLGLKPLLVTYNGNNYLDVGWRNLMRMDIQRRPHHGVAFSRC